MPCLRQAHQTNRLGDRVSEHRVLVWALSWGTTEVPAVVPHGLPRWVWRHLPVAQGDLASAWLTGHGTDIASDSCVTGQYTEHKPARSSPSHTKIGSFQEILR